MFQIIIIIIISGKCMEERPHDTTFVSKLATRGGNVSDLVVARNCCLVRMLPG